MSTRSKAIFSQEALQFLCDLDKNNNRNWFQERKEFFESEVRAPVLTLAERVNEVLANVAPDFVTDPKKSVMRIYRDTRFSADKRPYKNHMAAQFYRTGTELPSSGFYIGIYLDQVVVGSGVYYLMSQQYTAMRAYLAEHYKELTRLTKGYELMGESLQRPPKGFPADHPAIDLLKKKQWMLHKLWPPDFATDSKFPSSVLTEVKRMAPFASFLDVPLKALDRKLAKDPLRAKA
ncbi:MAG TPA: DUF2461 domain-containing protein [Bryobacteraceae bacterium]|jgi:uncharacterized protein (TIGR02453 family)|nr:DUF2461 domain-containing protein [Bryobacteraceae bacterium]